MFDDKPEIVEPRTRAVKYNITRSFCFAKDVNRKKGTVVLLKGDELDFAVGNNCVSRYSKPE